MIVRAFDIFVDSAANLTDEMIENNAFQGVSYTCSIDGKEMECYEKGGPSEQLAKKFYDAMGSGSDTKTTLVNAAKIKNAVIPSLEAGKDVLFITISSQISGTYNQAKMAAEELKELYPERKMLVADSFNASLGEGMFAVHAARLGELGEDIETCAKWIEDHKLNMNSVFTVSQLKYLKRGGRISTTLAIAGTLLNIKPILKGDANGKIAFAGTERGRKKALARLAELFEKNVIGPESQTVCIAHADCLEDAELLRDMLIARGATDVVINMYDICTGAHVGPGTVALFFMGKERGKSAEEANTATAKGGIKARRASR